MSQNLNSNSKTYSQDSDSNIDIALSAAKVRNKQFRIGAISFPILLLGIYLVTIESTFMRVLGILLITIYFFILIYSIRYTFKYWNLIDKLLSNLLFTFKK